MTLQQQKQADYLQDLFTLCEGWLYAELLPGAAPVQGGLAARAAALRLACARAAGQPLPAGARTLNEWLPQVLCPGGMAGLRTPLLHLPQNCLQWGWQERRLRECSGERPALEVLAAALCADSRVSVADGVELLAAWHRVVALCLAAQLQHKTTGNAAVFRQLVTLLAGKRASARRKAGETLLGKMNAHCDALRGKKDDETKQLSRWGNGFTLPQLVYAAKADRKDAVQPALLPASVLRTHKKPDIAKVASLWKLTELEEGGWSRMTGDGFQWLQDTRTEDLMPLLQRYGEKHTVFFEEEPLPEQDAAEPAAPPAEPERKYAALLDYCHYAGDPHFAPITMARWKPAEQVQWEGERPADAEAEWFAQGGTRAHRLMERYTDCCNAMGHRSGQPYYNPEALALFAGAVAAAGEDWAALPERFEPAKKPKTVKAPARFDLAKLFGPAVSRTARERFVQGLWQVWSDAPPADAAAVAALLDELLCPNRPCAGLAQEVFAAEAAVPEWFAQAVCSWGAQRYAACPAWADAYLSYKGKQAAWVFTVPGLK